MSLFRQRGSAEALKTDCPRKNATCAKSNWLKFNLHKMEVMLVGGGNHFEALAKTVISLNVSAPVDQRDAVSASYCIHCCC